MVYLDCNATTPMEPEVRDAMLTFMDQEFGNEGSRTHSYGIRAKQAVQKARAEVADVVGASKDEVIFTSGATESNNLALFGLMNWGKKNGLTHIISSPIEHKAVLEPLQKMAKEGFEVELIPPERGGWVDPEKIHKALRSTTLLVAAMHANNETGVLQKLPELIQVLNNHPAYLFVDAAQTFGKWDSDLKNPRVDMISASAHKNFGPKGIGALILRRRGYESIPLEPLMAGGGQEMGLRPGTLPVHLIVGFGKAAELSLKNYKIRFDACKRFRNQLLLCLQDLKHNFNGDAEKTLVHTVNISFEDVNSEAAIVALKDVVAISNGSACTSSNYQPSHVLKSMGLDEKQIMGAIRFSWCHMTPEPDWNRLVQNIKKLM